MPSPVSPFPAVLIGGPPHSGKSVLVYSLSRALRQANVPHYVLRACPDGEGDWSNQADQSLARTIRIKGKFNDAYVARIARYLANRHLPLLVDVGGRPTEAQQALFGLCTHAILLAAANDPAAYAREMAEWQKMLLRQQVTPLAYLESLLPGEDRLDEIGPPLTGAVANLQRGETAVGPVITALVNRLSALLAYNEAELARIQLAHSPVELDLDLPAPWARPLVSGSRRCCPPCSTICPPRRHWRSTAVPPTGLAPPCPYSPTPPPSGSTTPAWAG